MARGFRGVRDDLSELARHLLDLACFLSPLLAPVAHDSPPPSPRPGDSPSLVVAGILADLSEISGGLRAGLSRFSTAVRSRPPPERESDSRGGGGVSEEVVEFVRELVECRESWLDFPVPVDDVFSMSRPQREHVATVERLAPSLAALRISLCPRYMSKERFWKIYFALLHPKLNKDDINLLSTQQIVDSMRVASKERQHRMNTQTQSSETESFPLVTSNAGIDIKQGNHQPQEAPAITKTTSRQSIQQWSEVASEVDDTIEITNESRADVSYRDVDDGSNILLMEQYMDQLIVGGEAHSPSSLQQDHSMAVPHNRQVPSDEESGDWQAVEDSDFEMIERP